jgi:plasmid stabilization system protein ParE
MTVTLHRSVRAEVDKIMDRYEAVAGPHLADEFYSELYSLIRKASQNPRRFRIIEGDLRRANLKRFPYHFLFRVIGDSVRVLVVRHYRWHPSLGLKRQ